MSMRRAKALGDARQGKAQLAVILLVLALAIGGAVGALDARAILDREIHASFDAANVPDLALWMDSVDASKLALVARQPGVGAVDARRVVNTRVLARDGTWLPMRITVRAPTSTLGVAHSHRVLSADPDALAIEQSGEDLLPPGASLRLRRPGGETREVPVRGFVHDPAVAPSTQDRVIYAFATPALAARLGYPATLDQLLVRLTERGTTGEASESGTWLGEVLANAGDPPVRIEVLAATHPHMPLNLAMVRVLAVLGGLAAACGAAIAGYLVSAWMRREVRIVGILKTLGARNGRIASQYLLLFAPLAALGAAFGFALGTLLARVIVTLEAGVTNIDVASLEVPRDLTIAEIAIALAVPLLAMAVPIARAARLRPLAALQDAGIVVPQLAARFTARVLRAPTTAWSFALRNVWRRPWRTAIMVAALAAGGALLLVSKTTYVSIMAAVDRSLAHEGHDVELLLQKPQRAATIAAIAGALPGVAVAEPWQRASVSGSASGRIDTESARFVLVGYPTGSRLFLQPVVEGRAPAAPGEALATRNLIEVYPELAVGGSLVVRFGDRESKVRVSGLIEPIGATALFAPEETFRAITGLDGALSVRAKALPGVRPDALANELEAAFIDARLTPTQVVSRTLVRDSLDEHVEVVGGLMRAVALAAALIGALVLVAAVAFNVAERRREVGILRALGAGAGHIRTLFLIESGAVLAAGIAFSIAVSLPLARAILDAGERSLLRVRIPMTPSLEGLAWLAASALVVFLAVRITLAWALRASAREALASE